MGFGATVVSYLIADWASQGQGWQADVIYVIFTMSGGLAGFLCLGAGFEAYSQFKTQRTTRSGHNGIPKV